MGAWGTGIFENDNALDWLYDLEERGADQLRATLFKTANYPGHEYLDATDATEAVAAAAVVAGSLAVTQREALPENATAWLDSSGYYADYPMINAARLALGRILADNSELRDLWEESEYFQAWMEDVRKLLEFINLEAEEIGDAAHEGNSTGFAEPEVLRNSEHYTVYRGYIDFVEDVWGPGIFEHRDAVEFVCALEGKTPSDLLKKIKTVSQSKDSDWLLMTDACEALVTMSLLTAMENPGYWLMLPPEGREWLAKHDYQVSEADRQLCAQCLERIFRHKSEWIDYWDGGKDFGNARQAVFEMARGLGIICQDSDVVSGTKFLVSVNPVKPGLAKQPEYHPQRGITALVLILAVAICLVMVALSVMEISDYFTWVHDKGEHSLTDPIYLRNTDTTVVLNWVWVCCYISLFLAFPIMISRRHANLPALASHGIGYGPGKALFSTLIPWIGWFGDYAAVQDVLRASHPKTDPANPLAWQGIRHYWPVIIWWLGWSYLAFFRLAFGVGRSNESPADVRDESWLVVIASILMIVLMASVIVITRALARRQSKRREAVEIHAGKLGLTADDYTVVLASNVKGFGGRYREEQAPMPALRRDSLRVEKWVYLGVVAVFALLLLTVLLMNQNYDTMMNIIATVFVAGIHLFAAWRVFFGGVKAEKTGCSVLAVLSLIVAGLIIFIAEIYKEPSTLPWYVVAAVIHLWLLTITFRDARRWRPE